MHLSTVTKIGLTLMGAELAYLRNYDARLVVDPTQKESYGTGQKRTVPPTNACGNPALCFADQQVVSVP